jgi:hypothetical protein
LWHDITHLSISVHQGTNAVIGHPHKGTTGFNSAIDKMSQVLLAAWRLAKPTIIGEVDKYCCPLSPEGTV